MSTACPKCGLPGMKHVTHVCLFAGLPYEHQPKTLPMAHQFQGDPWGPCSACAHPAYHAIHKEHRVT